MYLKRGHSMKRDFATCWKYRRVAFEGLWGDATAVPVLPWSPDEIRQLFCWICGELDYLLWGIDIIGRIDRFLLIEACVELVLMYPNLSSISLENWGRFQVCKLCWEWRLEYLRAPSSGNIKKQIMFDALWKYDTYTTIVDSEISTFPRPTEKKPSISSMKLNISSHENETYPWGFWALTFSFSFDAMCAVVRYLDSQKSRHYTKAKLLKSNVFVVCWYACCYF